MSSNDPSQAISAVDAMREDWTVIAPLMGGTKAMRAAGKLLLPQYPAEEDDAYKERLRLSTLLPAYAETVGNMTSRVFAESLQLGDDVPPTIADLCLDVDRAGNDLNSWAVEWFRAGLSHGLCHALVDYPQTSDLRTRADEIAAGVRPYAVLIKPEQVLGWRSNGGLLSQVRYVETVEEDDGEFGVACVMQIRVLEPGIWRIYRKPDKDGAWVLHDEGTNSLSRIPWVTFYTGRTGLMTAKPPLLELAHLNVEHWQIKSDLRNIQHVAMVPLLCVLTNDEQFQLVISSGSATRLPEGSDMKYVEHSGQSAGEGRQALADLVQEMRMAGAKLLQQDKQQTKTATQAAEEAAQELSPLARMAGQFADCLAQLLQLIADYLGIPDGGSVEMRGNFSIDYAPELSLPQLLAMANAGKLSDGTLFAEFQRRGVISDEYAWDDERERLEAQGPALGSLGA